MTSRIWRFQDWEAQIDRIIGFTNIARITILLSLMIFSVFASESRHAIGRDDVVSVSVVMQHLQGYPVKVWFVVYGVLMMMGIIYPNWQRQNRWETPNVAAVADITMMVLLMHLLGGISSGFGILVLPFLAVSCLLSDGRYAILYASYASLLIVISMFMYYFPFREGVHTYIGMFASNILLVAGCYLVSFLTSLSATYLSKAGESVRRHRSEFERITALSKVVLNRMQEAVIVVDKTQRVWLHNQRALFYFPNLKVNQQATFVQALVRRWISNTKRQNFETNIMINHVDMNVRATSVYQDEMELLILFIRDEKERLAEAQSVKLTSLGLLTANLAHEIRNPLSAMRQANGLLMESMSSEDMMINKLSAIIDKNIARVDRMIEEVSTLNKSDRLNKDYIYLDEFWKNFQQEFLLTRPEAAGCLKVDIGLHCEVIFDPMHLQQILWNLCNNAWRHSKKGKNALTIIIRRLSNSDFVSIGVGDDGGGVPEDVQVHLFEPFFTTQTQSEGTGLGLYVARELAHANKGDLRYHAKRKIFEILLPKARYDEK